MCEDFDKNKEKIEIENGEAENAGNDNKTDKEIKENDSNKDKKSTNKKIKTLESKIKEEKEKVSDLSDKILRLNAEFENYRKRTIRERDDIRVNTRVDAIETIAPVLDHFELALNAAGDSQNHDALLEGMKMIKSEFEKALTSLGVEVINAEGEEFDPNLHEAMANEPSENIEKNIVIKQWRPGYKINNRLIRPATVIVSSGKSEE